MAIAQRRSRAALTALLLYLVLSFAIFAIAWRDPGSRVIGNGGDAPQFIWFLRWVPYAISHGLDPLITHHVDYPNGANLMWNAAVPAVATILWPVTAAFGGLVAYNLAVTLAIAFSAWTAYLMLRRLGGRPLAAAVGGALYGFSPYMMGQALSHLNLVVAVVPPLMVIALHEAVIRQQRRPVALGTVIGVLVVVQLLTSQELLATSVVFAFIGLALLAGLHPEQMRARAGYLVRVTVSAGITALALGAAPLAVLFLGPDRLGGQPRVVNWFVTDVVNLVLPTQMQAVSPGPATAVTDHILANVGERDGYLGVPLVVLLVWSALRLWRRDEVKLWCVLALITAALSLGITVYVAGRSTHIPVLALGLIALPYLRHRLARVALGGFVVAWVAMVALPLFDDILQDRLTLFTYLAAAVLVVIVIEDLTGSGQARRTAAAIAAGAVALVPLTPIIPYPSTALPLPSFFTTTSMSQLIPTGSVALVAPFADSRHDLPMLWQAETGMRFRMPEGYMLVPGGSHGNPPASATESALLSLEGGANVRAVGVKYGGHVRRELRAWGVQSVIVGPDAVQQVQGLTEVSPVSPMTAGTAERLVAFFTGMLHQEPVVSGGAVYVWPNAAEGLSPTLETSTRLATNSH
jgi:hypothetical protein